jgi:hypothetical protein
MQSATLMTAVDSNRATATHGQQASQAEAHDGQAGWFWHCGCWDCLTYGQIVDADETGR